VPRKFEDTPMQSLTAALVEMTQAIAFDRLSPSTIAAAKRAILDTLGCAIAAQGCEPARIAALAVPREGNDATAIGERGRTSVDRAVLLNGILVRYLDYMDVYWAKDVIHPAENVPLALACVESMDGDGKALIEAVVVGYEAQMRLAHTVSLTTLGMHHVSGAGIVCPLVIGKAWNLEARAMEHAVALAGCRQLAMHAISKGELSMAKAIGYPWSAMASLMAVRLAREGYTGPVDFLEWLARDGPLPDLVERAAFERDGTSLIEQVSFKNYPVQFELQTPVEVAIRLRADIADPLANIAGIEIDVLPMQAKRTADPAKYKPRNRETADHSLPVCVAMALLDGKLTAHQFETDRWAAAEVAALTTRVAVRANTDYAQRYPGGRPVGMRVRLNDGRVLEDFQEAPTGDVTRPLDDAALERKFLQNAEGRIEARRAAEIIACVRGLEHATRISELTRLLAGD